ncbi:MFS transporter [Actinokineospora globicatena]|uniref:MFS transporter n=1 Tax=Actinokineospora globicatena TaxID=103729 RepID=UPI0020A54E55|nr:MFS transporter [Actinokineospora globicatena]MCP2303143.1 putative arabinose efflux permease, MFS family [Actinokineospora globicatena]
MGAQPRTLWGNGDFRNLWIGQTASMLGSHVTAVLLPLIAAITLSASVFELGLLTAAGYLPYLVISLFAGVWLDRRAKRPIIVAADLLRGLALAVVPVGLWAGALTVPVLLVITLVVGFCSVVSDIGGASYLPAVVGREDLVEGNSKLELSSSVTNVGGNAVGGAVLQVLSAPVAMLFNAATYLVSAVFTARIGTRGETADERSGGGSMWTDIAEGARFVVGQPAIRVMVIATLISNFCALALEPLFLVFVTRTLRLDPFYIGLIFAASGVGALIGAVCASWLNRRLGLGAVIVLSTTVAGLASILTPVATLLPEPAAITLLVLMHLVDAAMIITCNINLRSYRAAITPDALQGRMNASIRMVVMGIAPLGGVFGGLLGGWLSITSSLVVISAGILLSAAIVFFSPIRKVRAIPTIAPAGDDAAPPTAVPGRTAATSEGNAE